MKRLVLMVLLLAGVTALRLDAGVAYSFQAGSDGGGAHLEIDAQTGKIGEHRVLFRNPDCKKAKKVCFTASGKTVAVSAATGKTPNLFFCPAAGGPMSALGLPAEPDEIRAVGEGILASCEDGSVVLVDAATAKIVRMFSGHTELKPPGRNGEDVFVLPDESAALVSYEGDNRVVLLDLPGLTLRADLLLPRERPEVQMPDDWTRRGPQPEIVLAATGSKVILATLDQYGAVGLLDLAAAMGGKCEVLAYLSTALDGSWGNSFPDRADLLTVDGREYALVTNAGPDGGAVLVDLAAHKVVKRWKVPHGLEKPVFPGGAKIAVATPAGKLKRRGAGRTYVPGDAVYVFDFRQGVETATASKIPADVNVYHAVAVDPEHSALVVLAGGKGRPDELLVIDAVQKRILDRQPAQGEIQRLHAARNP